MPNQSAGGSVLVPARISKYRREAPSLPPTVPRRVPEDKSSPTLTSIDAKFALSV